MFSLEKIILFHLCIFPVQKTVYIVKEEARIMNAKELELIQRLKKKDQKALEEIIRLFHQYVAAIVCRILYGQADQTDVQSVINDIFFRLWENADHIKTGQENNLKSYIGALARNTALTEKKKLRHTCSLEEDILGEVPDHFHQVELRSMILSALKELNPEEQTVLLKFYFQSKTMQEIADESGDLLPTVKSRLQRSRKKFRKILEERGFNYENQLL